MLGISRLHRYVASEMVGPIALGFSLFTFLLMMNAFFLLAQKAIAKNLPAGIVLRLLALELPNLLVLTIPMAVLFGCLIGVGRLSADDEWTAIQASGLGIGTLLRPLAAVGLLATGVALWLYWVVVPASNYQSRTLRGEVALSSNLAADLTARRFYSQLEDMVLYVEQIPTGRTDGALEGVFIHRHDREGRTDEFILARSGTLRTAPDRSGALSLGLEHGVVHHFREDDPVSYRLSSFERYQTYLAPPRFLESLRQAPSETVHDMDFASLNREVREARNEPDPIIRGVRERNALLERHVRVALPSASFLFALLAAPLGVRRARSGKGAGFAVSLFVLLLYYVVFIVARNEAARGAISPVLGAWAANLVIAPWFLWSVWRMRDALAAERGPLDWLRRAARSLARALRSLSPARVETSEIEREREESPEVVPSPHLGWSSRVIGRIDSYVASQYLRVLALSLAACYLLYIIVEIRRRIDDVLKNDLPLGILLEYFRYFLPGMLQYALPISCLGAAIVTITILSRSGELIAIKSTGTSARRVTVPILLITVALCGVYFGVQDRVAPASNQRKEEIKDRMEKRAPRTYGSPASGRWVFGKDGANLYHYRHYDQPRGEFRRLSVLTLDREQDRIVDHRYAAKATWNGTAWELQGSWYRSFPADPAAPATFERFSDAPVTLPLEAPEHFEQRAEVLSRGDGAAEQMSVAELREEISSLVRSGYDTTRLDVAYFAKFSQAAAPLVMVLIGLPFAFRIGKRGSLYGIGVAILLVVVYWATFAVFHALGLEGLLPPMLAAWAPNVLYGLLGAYLLLYVRT